MKTKSRENKVVVYTWRVFFFSFFSIVHNRDGAALIVYKGNKNKEKKKYENRKNRKREKKKNNIVHAKTCNFI